MLAPERQYKFPILNLQPWSTRDNLISSPRRTFLNPPLVPLKRLEKTSQSAYTTSSYKKANVCNATQWTQVHYITSDRGFTGELSMLCSQHCAWQNNSLHENLGRCGFTARSGLQGCAVCLLSGVLLVLFWRHLWPNSAALASTKEERANREAAPPSRVIFAFNVINPQQTAPEASYNSII